MSIYLSKSCTDFTIELRRRNSHDSYKKAYWLKLESFIHMNSKTEQIQINQITHFADSFSSHKQ